MIGCAIVCGRRLHLEYVCNGDMRCMGIICSAVWTVAAAVPQPERLCSVMHVKGGSGVAILLRSLFGKVFRHAMSAIPLRPSKAAQVERRGGIRINFQSGCRVVSRCAKSEGSRRSPRPSVRPSASVCVRPDMDRNAIHHTLLALHWSRAAAGAGGRGRVQV